MMESDKGKYFNINFHPDLSNIQQEQTTSPEIKKKESMEEEDKQLAHIFNGKTRNRVPMLNLGKIVDLQRENYQIDYKSMVIPQAELPVVEDEAGITVTDVNDATGTATSPLDALVEGLQDL